MGDRAAPQGMWGWAVIGGILLAGVLVPFALVEAPVERLSLAALAADLGALGMGLIVAALLALDLVLPVPSSLGEAGAVPPWAGAAPAPWLADAGVIVAVRAGQQLALADRAHHRPAWTAVLREDGVNTVELSAFDTAPGPLTVLERGALVWSYDAAGSR